MESQLTLRVDSETLRRLERVAHDCGDLDHALMRAVALMNTVVEQQREGFTHILLCNVVRDEFREVEFRAME